MKRLMLLALLAAACGGSDQGMDDADSTATDSVMPAAIDLTMPEAPSASRGRIALRTAGELELTGEWPARAGWCAAPPMLQVLLEQQYDGAIILLALPATGSRVTTYPVTTSTEGIPEGPAAQAAVQRIVDSRPYAWQAETGDVDLYAWDGNRVSGRFTITMRNIATNERSMMAGSFLGVEAFELGADQCQPGAPAAN